MVVRRDKLRIEKPYPTTDGKPMAETDRHRKLSTDLIWTLDLRFQPDLNVYVSGSMLIFYARGNRRKYISPDVFVVKGVPKARPPQLPDLERKQGARRGDRADFEVNSSRRYEA
jgi:hypothetical protein